MDATILESLPVFSGISSTDTAACIDLDELAEAENNLVNLLGKFSGWGQNDSLALRGLGIDKLQKTNGEGGCFACS